MRLGAGREIVPVHPVKPRDQCTDVRFGSGADILGGLRDVRFTPKSGHWLNASGCPLCAKEGQVRLSK